VSEPVLIATNVVAGYVRGMPIVHDVSLDVSEGEIVTIIGPNGAGKSTLVKALAGLILFEGGSVRCRGRDVSNLPAHAMIEIGLGFVPQTGNIFTGLTIHENLVMGGHNLSSAVLKERLNRTYDRFPLLAERRS
jgi:branched-chain amino acid transport system ATP-binding protein